MQTIVFRFQSSVCVERKTEQYNRRNTARKKMYIYLPALFWESLGQVWKTFLWNWSRTLRASLKDTSVKLEYRTNTISIVIYIFFSLFHYLGLCRTKAWNEHSLLEKLNHNHSVPYSLDITEVPELIRLF